MITRTDTLDQVRPLTNAERVKRYYQTLARHCMDSELTEPIQEYRHRLARGIAYQRALHQGHPGKVTGIYGEREDAPRNNVVSINRETA